MQIIIVFCHGWGFDANFGKCINNLNIKNKNIICFNINLGYIGQSNLFNILNKLKNNNYFIIAVGHSMGFIKLLNLNIKFDLLIGIQSFINFLGFNNKLKSNRTIALNSMIKNFNKNPNKILLWFYKHCNLDCKLDNKIIDYQLLNLDLTNLYLNYSNNLPKNIPVLILAALDDPVVPIELILDNFKDTQAIIRTNNNGKHNLLSNNKNFVIDSIDNFINKYA